MSESNSCRKPKASALAASIKARLPRSSTVCTVLFASPGVNPCAAAEELGLRHAYSAMARMWLGLVEWGSGHYQQARQELQSALAMAREIDWKRGVGACLLGLGCITLVEGAPEQALKLFEDSAAYREGPAPGSALRQQVLQVSRQRVVPPRTETNLPGQAGRRGPASDGYREVFRRERSAARQCLL
jgi:hypothetical protein